MTWECDKSIRDRVRTRIEWMISPLSYDEWKSLSWFLCDQEIGELESALDDPQKLEVLIVKFRLL